MYNRAGVMKKIKSSILSFSGIPDLDDDARERLAQRVGKLSMELLKRIMDTLGVRCAVTMPHRPRRTHRVLAWSVWCRDLCTGQPLVAIFRGQEGLQG